MPRSYNSDLFNKDPYFDDFDVDKGYLRSLFRPGTAVQARELTQIQTVLQNQVESIGSHIFENGAVVAGGGIAEANASYLRVDTANSLSTSNLESLVGKTISNGTVNARVVKTLAGSTLDKDPNQVVIYQYTSNGSFSAGGTLATSDASGITFGIAAGGVTAPSIGDNATFISVDQGIFYLDGFFINTSTQNVAPFKTAGITYADSDDRYRDFSNPTSSVGWSLTRDIVDSVEDSTLKDPAAGYYNYNAPGSDRYKIGVTLDFIPFTSSLGDSSGLTFDSKNFVELVRLVSGKSTKKVKYTEYADLEETFARRTFDESGNYTVNTPKVRIVEHTSVFSPGDSTKFAVGIEPNKSYVGGFEIDTQSTTYIAADKTRTTNIVPSLSEFMSTPVGNYVLVDSGGASGYGIGDQTVSTPTSSLEDLDEFFIYGKTGPFNASAGVTIGSCNVRSISRDPEGTKVSLFNIDLRAGEVFSESTFLVSNKSVAAGGHTGATGSYYKLKANSAGQTGPFDANSRSLIFPVSSNRVVSNGPGSSTQRRSQFLVNEVSLFNLPESSTSSSITLSGGRSVPDQDDENYLVFYGETAGSPASLLPEAAFDASVVGANQPNPTITISGLTAGPAGGITFAVVHPVVFDSTNMSGQNIYRTLNLDTVTETSVSSSTTVTRDGIQCIEFVLSDAHVKEITYAQNNATDITTNVTGSGIDFLDDGQRRSAIFRSKLYVPVVDLVGDGSYDLIVSYTKYTHSGIGPVTLDSYLDNSASTNFSSVPTFVDPDSGESFRLGNCVDFRPIQKSGNDFNEFGVPFDKSGSASSRIGYSYFLPRIDVVSLCKDRTYRLIKGVASDNPQPPVTTEEDMDLFILETSPYVFDINKDVNVKYLDNNRFTMKEIGEISNLTDNVQRDRYIEFLFSDAQSRAASITGTVVSPSVMVDDFSSHQFADVFNKDHNCSMDYRFRGLRPSFETSGLGLTQATIPSGMVLSDNNVLTYSFNETTVFSGATGTSTIQINPFGITDFLGFLEVSPKCDFYYDNNENPSVLVNTFGENNQYFVTTSSWEGDGGRSAGWGGQKDEFLTHWFGTDSINSSIPVVDPSSRDYKSPVKGANSKLPDRIKRTVNDKTVDESVLPKMRSKTLSVTGKGFLPNSTLYAFVDGQIIGNSADGYTANNVGGFTAELTLDSGLLSGEKSIRFTSSISNNLSNTLTAGDTKYFSQGLQNVKNSTIVADIGSSSRRRSAKSENIISDTFLDSLDSNYGDVQNGLDPLSQEIIVDAGAFPQGLFLSSISFYFKTVDPTFPVTIQIRPMINDAPHEFISVPHSTVTLEATDINVSDGPGSVATKFSFPSPVYLPPGNWSVCMFTNGDQNALFRSVINQPYLNTSGDTNTAGDLVQSLNVGSSGIRVGSLFMPLNNGSRMKTTAESVMMGISRCSFTGGSTGLATRTASFNTDLQGSIIDVSDVVVASNDNLFTSDTVFPTFVVKDNLNAMTYNGVTPNKNTPLSEKINGLSTNGGLQVDLVYSSTTSNTLTPVVNLDRLGLVLSDSKYDTDNNQTGVVLGETSNNSAAANNSVCRYISKKVNFGNSTANDLRVFLDVAPNEGHVKVFAKVNNSSDNFDDQTYTQLYRDGDTTKEFDNDIENNTLNTYTYAPATGTTIGQFSTYAIKIVVYAEDGTSDLNLPVIKNLRAVAINS